MKPKGAVTTYNDERDTDLIRAYREVLTRHKHIHLPEVILETVMSPSKRFWVSEERAKIVIADMRKGKPNTYMNKTRQNMYNEIFLRVEALEKKHPKYPLHDLVVMAIEEPAPCFYMTEKSAKIIIHRIKKKCYMEKKQRLKHLFM